MNKVFNINLGGFPFTIDEDAYEHLSNYLQTIHNHFRKSEGYEEITNDIEARMAELFQEKLDGRPIVTLQIVRNAIAIMGTPEDFGAEPIEEGVYGGGAPKSSENKWKLKTGKRLFRNPDEEVIGGVCSGIAAYFGIQDPLWVRLIFVLLALTGGFAVPLYIILWAIVPKAETASDRLAMRGEPINASNIGKIIEEEIENVSKKVSELGDELKTEFGTKKKSTQHSPNDAGKEPEADSGSSHRIRAALAEGFYILGSVIRAVFDVLKRIIKPVAFVIGIVLVALLALIWFGAVGGLFIGLPFSSFLFPQSSLVSVLGVFNILFVIGIPLLMLILFVMRVFMRTHFKPRWAVGLWLFWVLNVVSLVFFFGVFTVRQFSHPGEVGLGVNKDITSADTLVVELAKNPYDDVLFRIGDKLIVSDKQLVCSDIRLHFEKSSSGKFEVVQSHFARGISLEEAQELGRNIDYRYTTEGNRLILPANFIIPKGQKYRGQHVDLTIKVPEGKWVKRSGNVNPYLQHIQTDENLEFPWWGYENYPWQMTANGMICPQFLQENQKDFSFKDFSRIRLEGKVQLRVRRGDQFAIVLTEGDHHAEDIDIRQSGDRLDISMEEDAGHPVVLEITMPALEELWAIETDDISLRDFTLPKLHIVNEGEGSIEAFVEVDSLLAELKGENKMTLRGKGRYLQVTLNDAAKLDAEHFPVQVADAALDNQSHARVSALDTLRQRVNDSKLVSHRNPVIVQQR